MQLAAFPRVRFAHLPTPLEPLERLSRALGGPRILVKRDDATGLALGGNKTRKLEFLVAEALAAGADTLVSTGGIQSNHVRQTAAAAARFGLGCELVLSRLAPVETDDYEETGNVQLDRLLGARLHVVAGDVDRNAAAEALGERLRREGRRPFVIPVGGSNATGALGYVAAALEIEAQAEDRGIVVDAVVHAASSGGTQAGLIAGFHAIRSRTRVVGIDVDADAGATEAQVRRLLTGLGERLGLGEVPGDAVLVVGGHAGRAYGEPTPEMVAAVTRVARLEGIVLDPVYGGKAMAGLIDLVERGRFSAEQTVVFLHTGGAPSLFAYRRAFAGRGEAERRQ